LCSRSRSIGGLTGSSIIADIHGSKSFYRHSIAFLLLLQIMPVDSTMKHKAEVLGKKEVRLLKNNFVATSV
jgi:hypothetical protein